MNSLLLILIIIISVVLVLFVLVQNPKGGGLNSEFGSAGLLGGAKRTTDILEKGTWGLAIGLALICLLLAPNYSSDDDSGTSTKSEFTIDPGAATTDAE